MWRSPSLLPLCCGGGCRPPGGASPLSPFGRPPGPPWVSPPCPPPGPLSAPSPPAGCPSLWGHFNSASFFLSFPSLLFLLPSFSHLTLAKCAHRQPSFPFILFRSFDLSFEVFSSSLMFFNLTSFPLMNFTFLVFFFTLFPFPLIFSVGLDHIFGF